MERCVYKLEVTDSKSARMIVEHNMEDRNITDYRILRVQRIRGNPEYTCDELGDILNYKVYVEYNL